MDTTNTTTRFWESIHREMTATLATAAEASVTMRAVSPVRYADKILIFTAADSQKYHQLQKNPHACVAVDGFYVECTAELCGATMLPENAPLRAAYSAKFPGAFDENIAFGGRSAHFVLLQPTRLTGWAFPDDTPTADGIPTIPFAIILDT